MKNPESYRYKWVVLLSASLTCSLTWGLAYTIGLFYISWVDEFDAGNGEVAVIGGINTGVSCLLEPLYDVMNARLGYRKAGALSGILMAVGYIGSSLATNLFMLCFFYGVIQGFGFGLAYFGASLAVNKYFIQQRTFAEGMATFGSGAGGFGFTILSQYLIVTYGWRGAMLIFSGTALHIVVLFQLTFSPDQLDYLKLNWKTPNATDKSSELGYEVSNKDDSDLASVGSDDRIEIDDETEVQFFRSNDPENRTWLRRCTGMFRNPLFLLMLFTEFLCWIAVYVPFVHLPERARLLGIDATTVTWIASSISLSMCFGRIAITGICSALKIDPFYAYGFVNVVSGLLTVFSPFLTTKDGLLFYAIFYGLFYVSVPLIRASAASLLGPDVFSMAYGWIVAISGVGLFIGPALAGLLYDITESYDATFYASGACLIASGTMVACRNKAKRIQDAKMTTDVISRRYEL